MLSKLPSTSNNYRNRTGYQYFSSTIRTESPDKNDSSESAAIRARMLNNYLFSALAGVTWYMQFFFYTMGETQMGYYKFSSWTIHRASIIIFSSLWGIALHEWKGSGVSTKRMLAIGLITLVLSTIVVGYGNFLGVVGTT